MAADRLPDPAEKAMREPGPVTRDEAAAMLFSGDYDHLLAGEFTAWYPCPEIIAPVSAAVSPAEPPEGETLFVADSKARRQGGSEAYAALDRDLCMLCGAYGHDKRSLFIDCLYAIHEVVPEALDIREVEHERGRGYYLLICKSCRGSLLGKLQEWRNERVSLFDVPKDHDGYLLDEWDDDPERNIPVRVNGAIQMMTRDEWEAFRGR